MKLVRFFESVSGLVVRNYVGADILAESHQMDDVPR